MYEWWKTETKAWELVTDVPKAKRGIAIALSLLDNDSFEEISIDDSGKETGIKTLLDFVDLKLGKEDFEEFREI